MDTRQIEYMIKIADEGSVTRAAEALFITQSALTQQLQKIEQDLGAPLFIRNKSAWRPTPEGAIYLKAAREMLRLKREAYTAIADLSDRRNGKLILGMTPDRGLEMFSAVYPQFHALYPDITVEPNELSVRKQQKAIHRGELDLGFLTLADSQKTPDAYLDLFEEEIFPAVPASLADALGLPEPTAEDPYPVIALEVLAAQQFVITYKESTIRKIIDAIFEETGLDPKILFETSSNRTALSMISMDLACGLVPYHYVKKGVRGVRFFRLASHPTWKVCVSYPKGAYLSKAARTFIELAQNYWKE